MVSRKDAGEPDLTLRELLIYILIDPDGYVYDQSLVDNGSPITDSIIVNAVVTTDGTFLPNPVSGTLMGVVDRVLAIEPPADRREEGVEGWLVDVGEKPSVVALRPAAAADIEPGDHLYTIGVNYYVNPYLRFMANYVISEASDSPANGGEDEEPNAFAVRVAMDFK